MKRILFGNFFIFPEYMQAWNHELNDINSIALNSNLSSVFFGS